MVSPSKTKYSRVAANQQQKTASSNKVKLVKGPRPLIHHRFYLDIQRHQLANEIETTIKELGGQIEFFLNKEITHFITDKEYQQQPTNQRRGPESDSGHSSHHHNHQLQQRPATPTTPQTPRTPLSYVYHPTQHLQQYVNEASPSSPCIVGGTPNPTQPGLAPASGSTAAKPSIPRSRADAMLQRVRQQQQQYSHSNNPSSAPPSPCSPAPGNNSGYRSHHHQQQQSDRLQQSPAHLAKSWGKPIWTTEYAIKFFKKVIETCSGSRAHELTSLSKSAAASSSEPVRKPTNIQHLRGDFIKIESFQRHYRPAFQLFKKWPVLNLNTRSSASPFNSNNRDRDRDRDRKSLKTAATAATTTTKAAAVTNTTTTTTNTNQTNARTKPTQQQQQRCGYCEICRIEYDVLANHLAAEEHSAFVKNDANFVALDKLIGEGGVDLKAFLERNPPPPELEEEREEETVAEKEEPSEQVRIIDAESEANKDEEEKQEDTGVKCEEKLGSEVKKKTKIEEEQEECENEKKRIVVGEEASEQISPKVIRTYSRRQKDKNHILAPEDPAESHGSSIRSPPAKRTYVGRKQARRAAAALALAAIQASPSVSPKPKPADEDPLPLLEATPSSNTVDAHPPPEAASDSKDVSEAQMFGRRSAIYHHPHNTLNHHNHQKVKTARQLQQQAILGGGTSSIPSSTAAKVVPEVEVPSAEEMKVVNNEPIKNGPSSEKEKERQSSKRSAADRMGLKASSLQKQPNSNAVHHPSVSEMLECDGLDPKNTKRISLGLRQNPKRANLNEDFTSLLDETLGPMRKPRVRRESAKRVNYSEPREDEIASQEEIMQSILEKTAKEASENEAKKKKPGSPKRPLDVKIRGIQWRAPSPQARPPVKSPLLYKVIEDPKPKNKKTASPTKDSRDGGSPSKSTKNGLIVKIRRVRQSELSLLNDEAENFMFPKKDDSSDEETDEDRQTTSELEPGDYSQELPSSELDHHRNSISMRKSSGTPSGVPGRKRTTSTKLPPPDSPDKKAAKDSDSEATPRSRRAGARGPAALLQDNAEYYKFPDPGSRLRFPEAPIQPSPPTVEDDDHDHEDNGGKRRRGNKRCRSKTPATATMTSQKQQEHAILLATRSSPSSPYQHQEQLLNCGKTIINYVKGKEDGMGVFRWSNFRKNCKEIEPYRFAFERVPSLEPWYETFQRQDDCSEQVYEYFGNTAYRKLPYEMGALPPLKQNCCILNYRMKSKTPETAVPASSTASTSSSSSSSSSTSSHCGHKATTATTAATSTTSAAAAAASDDKEPLALPLKKRKLLVDSDRPRKSPREHASTLAILSLLQQQTQHNRRRTISSGSTGLPPIVTTNLPPPSPTPSAYSPKKAAIQAHHNSQQEADSALGDEIRSSCGSDPITEKEDLCAATSKKIKFDPPVMEESYENYKVMCQELDVFLSEMSEGVADEEDEAFFELKEKSVPIGGGEVKQPMLKNLAEIVRACDREAPLSLKQVSRRESALRKIVQYDRKPRPLSAVTIKSFDGGGNLDWTGRAVLYRKKINRTGWPSVKKRIVTRKQQQLKKEDGQTEVKGGGEEGDGSRKSSTEESAISGMTADTSLVKQEDEDGEEDEDEEFEDTMTMLDEDEPNGKMDTLLTDDEEEVERDVEKKADRSKSPVSSKVEEVRSASRLGGSSSRVLPSSRYVTKTTTTMTRVDYNVPATSTVASTIGNSSEDHHPSSVQNHSSAKGSKSSATSTSVPAPAGPEDDDKECDSISSRSIFVSDDCDTTSSTLINMQCTDEPLGSQRNSATPQPPQSAAGTADEPPRPASRARQNTTRHLHPVVCIEKLNCPTTIMRTRSSSRTPIKKTYKRSIFTTSLVTSAGKPHKKKRKKKHKLNGVAASSGASNAGSPSPSCSDELNSITSCEDLSRDTPTPPRKSIKDRPPTPSPIKFSPRKLRKPRGRWYRER